MSIPTFTVRHEVVLADDTKDFLTHLVVPVMAGITRLEHNMTQIGDFFDAQNATLDQVQTALTDVAADVTALLAKASTAGVFSADEQAKADATAAKLQAVSTALSALDFEVGDQDGSDKPVV